MPSISNETAIANLALTRLGAARITNIDTEQSENAAKIRAVFNLTRDDLLRSHTWNFAILRVNFNKLASTPLYGFAAQYKIPGNVLRILPPSTNSDSNFASQYKIEGDKVLTDDGTFQARCIVRIEDTTKWDASFVDLFGLLLQAELAYAIVNNRALAADLFNIFNAKLRSVKAIDAMEDTPDRVTARQWIESRSAGSFAPSTSLTS
jgi:hypothetical protein